MAPVGFPTKRRRRDEVAIPTLPYEESYLLYNRTPIPRGEPTGHERRDRVEPNADRNQRSATSRPEFDGSLGSLALLASTFPDLRRKNSLLSAKNSLFRCVGNSASKPLSFLTDWTSKSAAEASFSQIPCSFPCLAGNLTLWGFR